MGGSEDLVSRAGNEILFTLRVHMRIDSKLIETTRVDCAAGLRQGGVPFEQRSYAYRGSGAHLSALGAAVEQLRDDAPPPSSLIS
jgi:hypothetical protein